MREGLLETCRATVAVALLAGPPAIADEPVGESSLHPYLTNGLFVDIGLLYARRDIEISVDGTNTPSRSVDLEETLGFDATDQAFAVELGWRFGRTWSLSGQFFEFSASNRTTLEDEIEFEDEVFPVGANVDFGSGITVTRFFFGRQFKFTRDRSELGVGGGIHWVSLSSRIAGDARIGDNTTEFKIQSARAEGPLPNIGFWYRYSMSPRLAFRTRFDWLEASVGRYDGKLINFGVGFNYEFLDWLGGGINYNYFELDATINDDDWRGAIDTDYSGFFVNLTGFF